MKIETLPKTKSLSLLAGINRSVNPSQVTKLANSLKKMGNIRPLVVAYIDFLPGKSGDFIIDGQHLFHALIRNNLPIEYVRIDIKNKKELVEVIALLNSSSKSWSMCDYVTAWASIHNDYTKLDKYFKIYDFEVSYLASVLEGTISIGGSLSKRLKAGEFRIKDELENVQVLDNLTDVLHILPRLDRIANRYTCLEFVKMVRTCPKYDHKQFLEKLTKQKSKFILAVHEPDLLARMFKDLLR